ncbi:MAG: helix-turn-helix domain-containing protein [Kiritimatiellae bacterium]|nr:helix-turn-helix domain-containing protein [Kiritimatiellia bacterium]
MKKIEHSLHPTTVEEIGHYIRAIRRANKLTQQELSDLSGVNRRFLSELENGKATAEIGKVLHVLKCIGCDITLRYRQ